MSQENQRCSYSLRLGATGQTNEKMKIRQTKKPAIKIYKCEIKQQTDILNLNNFGNFWRRVTFKNIYNS